MTLIRVSVVFLVLFVGLSVQFEDVPRTRTPLGAVKGYYKISAHGRQYAAYEGIPYALPPIGKLRFKPPHRLPPWVGELPATKFASPCLQYEQIPSNPPDKVMGSEDCLYLNVYVPVRDDPTHSAPLMPVIFWIHGGAFQFGTGAYRGAKYLMDRDVVFVTINYRLGPLGFLSTEDAIVPGNMGLKDQSMALRWVSENIEWFRGDPKKITLTGLSAGGASVHYQYLSPMSAGLFHAGISFSGTSFSCWTQTEHAAEKTKKLAAIMGCPTTSSKEMIRCLRYRPGRQIVQATEQFMPWLFNPFTPFGPVPEKFGDLPFINRTPDEIVASGDVTDVPWITGVVSEEGLYPAAEFIADDERLNQLNKDWDLIAPHYLDYNFTLPAARHVEVAKLVREHYFGTKPINKDTVKEVIQMSGDRFFIVGSEKAARAQAKVNQSPVWYYYFSYRGAHSLSEAMSGTGDNYGVSHADDAYLVLDTPYFDPSTTADDRKIQQELIDFWVSVATNGVPQVSTGVQWPKLDPTVKELHYMHFSGPGKYAMETSNNFGDKDFWDSLGFNENKVAGVTAHGKDEL